MPGTCSHDSPTGSVALTPVLTYTVFLVSTPQIDPPAAAVMSRNLMKSVVGWWTDSHAWTVSSPVERPVLNQTPPVVSTAQTPAEIYTYQTPPQTPPVVSTSQTPAEIYTNQVLMWYIVTSPSNGIKGINYTI